MTSRWKQTPGSAQRPKMATGSAKEKEEGKTFRPLGKLHKIRSQVPEGLNLSRKELRKEMRQMKKLRRNAYHSRSKEMPTLLGKLAEKHKQQVAKQEAIKLLKEKQEKQKRKNAIKRQAREERKKAYEKAEKLKREKEEEERRIKYEEEKEIKQLEKQLHMNKRKSKLLPKKFIEEGLDYILDAIDPAKVNESMANDDDKDVWMRDQSSEEESDGDQSSEEESDGAQSNEEEFEVDQSGEEFEVDQSEEEFKNDQSGGGKFEVDQSDEEESEVDQSVEESVEEMESEEDAPSAEESESDVEMDSEGDSDVDVSSGQADVSDEGAGDVDTLNAGALKEDIYGRLRDSEGNVVTQTYVPPARRREMLDDSTEGARRERLQRLKKQLKGQLNRLSDSNMVSISNHIESLYRQQSRADMNSSLRELATDMVLSDLSTPERLSMELAMLIAILHNNIGTEIGATFLEMLAEMFKVLHSTALEDESSKKINNVTAFLCHLYSFQVTHCVLITDIIYELIDSFKDRDIELILLMLKSVGFTLRKDDPVALKDIIMKTQQKANDASLDTYSDKSRVKFMLEIVLAIKNNNMRKIPNYDTSHMDRLKRQVKGCLQGGASGGQLKITYKELLEAKDKGKWWVVGSAWQGTDLPGKQANAVTQGSQATGMPTFSEKLLNLARKQRMNTDTRRMVFCTIMSAEDFVDAFEKLLKLELKSKQERDIVAVILECCGNETQYNAYYTHLVSKFIAYHRRFLFTFQTCMWDRFSILSTLPASCWKNLAELCAKLIVDQVVPLSLLKKIEFGDLDKAMVSFLKTLLNGIFKADKKTIAEIFYKVGAAGKKLNHLKEGLELYMHHFMLRKCKEDAKAKLEQLVAAAESGLKLDREAVMF